MDIRDIYFDQNNVGKQAYMDRQEIYNQYCYCIPHENIDKEFFLCINQAWHFFCYFEWCGTIHYPIFQGYGAQYVNATFQAFPANQIKISYIMPLEIIRTIKRTVQPQNTKQYFIQSNDASKLSDTFRKTKFKIISSDCKSDLLDHDNKANNNPLETQNTAVGVKELEMDNNLMLDEHHDQPLTTSTVNCVSENGESIVNDGKTKSSVEILIEKIEPLDGIKDLSELSDILTEDPQTFTVDGDNMETTKCIQEFTIHCVSDVSTITEQRVVESGERNHSIDCDTLKSVITHRTSVTERQTEGSANNGSRSRSSLPETIQNSDVRNSDLTDTSDINIRAVKQHTDTTLENHLPLDVNDSHLLSHDSVPRTLYRNNDGPQNGSTDCDHDDNASKMKQQSVSAGLTCNVVHFPEYTPDQPAILKDVMKKLSNDTERVVGPRDVLVLPAVQNNIDELRRIVDKTVQGEPVPAQESMRFELLRSCTYRTFPKDGKPDVRKLAEAGFYYASNSDEVICYCCYKRISNWKADDDPLAIHRRISPECRFFTDAATVNVTKELTAQVESEIMAKIQGGRQRNTTTQSAPLQIRKDSQNPGNVADAGVSLRERQPARAHGQFAMAHSGETSLPMHQPPVNPRESTKYLSMMPPMARNETASPNRSQFQTGVFVPQNNFRVPVIDTRAVQPSDDTPGQDAVIDEHVRESNSRIEDVSTSVATSSARAETSRASTEPPSRSLDSMMRSDASVLVQGMGYELPIVRQALSNLLDRGQAQPDAQEIMNEIFLIEDGAAN